jgi:glycerol-1-phosphatase
MKWALTLRSSWRRHMADGASTYCDCMTRARRTGNVCVCSACERYWADIVVDISELEGRIPKEFGQDADEIPGARALLQKLDAAHAPWAVVTSGTRALITGWIERLKLAKPEVLVVAEEVTNGKPDPEGYLLGRERLGLQDKQNMIVFEDAPSGIRAGKAAGFRVVGLATTHTLKQVREAGADWIVKDLRSISLKSVENGVISIAIHDALVDS